MMSRPASALLLCFVLGFSASATVLAMGAPSSAAEQNESNFGIEGKITKASPGKLTINSQDNMLFHITYGPQTQIKLKDGSAGTAADLKPGVVIRADGSLDPQGVLQARRISVE